MPSSGHRLWRPRVSSQCPSKRRHEMTDEPAIGHPIARAAATLTAMYAQYATAGDSTLQYVDAINSADSRSRKFCVGEQAAPGKRSHGCGETVDTHVWISLRDSREGQPMVRGSRMGQ